MTPLPFAPTVPELAAANREASRIRPRRSLRRVVIADARTRRRPC